MEYRIEGLTKDTGKAVACTVSAGSEAVACDLASDLNVVVEHVTAQRPIPPDQLHPTQSVSSSDIHVHRVVSGYNKLRAALLMLAG